MSKRSHHHRRRKPRFQRRTAPGASPGSVKPHPDALPCAVKVLAYGPDELVEEEIRDLDRLPEVLNKHPVTWINVDGLGDEGVVRRLGELLGLHALALEDVVNAHQRAKVEPYDSHLFVVARMTRMMEHLETEQISLFVGSNYVLTFQERHGDCLDPVRERIRKSSGKIRNAGADYLTYALLDAVIDSYFPVLDQFADHLEELEDEVAAGRSADVTARIHAVRNDLLVLRRSIRPHREALNELVRDDNPLIADETRVFLRDCYDHTVQLMDLLEVYREMCADLRDYYLSIVSNRMNEVMKVLTIIATIFIPLGFIAGLYGMNFDTDSPWNMPELRWPFGYAFALALMLGVAATLLFFFRRKGWIGSPRMPSGSRRGP
ncbi:MAG: magnesium/cobalt transporter CorA [Planctomycetes bacterium]|nr:magnesium/cobalt transporter CorA [Planctomycetota bacterium]MBL7043467.1 magnesium/cobalt transporter CorA [Pirellulaceae bacterium]